jgi:uncharacterized protein (TIGR02145 family)
MKKIYISGICKFLIISVLLIACNSEESEPEPIPVPVPPTNLVAMAISVSQIDLTWEDNSNNETGFKLERQSGSDSYSLLVTLEANRTSYSDIAAEENTTYSYRIFAFNAAPDVSEYSNEVSSTTFEALTVTDFDGNVYPTVSIGTQVWMAENLKTTKLTDGTAIPLVSNDSEWNKLTTPGLSWYDNLPSNGDTYGALYNWYTVETSNLCPSGWHVPTVDEWTTLSDYLGGENVAGGKLKESGIQHWITPNTLATDEFGFTALPGGDHDSHGSYNFIGKSGRWWTSTESGTGTSWYRFIAYESSAIIPAENTKNSGFSVRCVLD